MRPKLVTCLCIADVNTIVTLKVMASYVLIYIFFILIIILISRRLQYGTVYYLWRITTYKLRRNKITAPIIVWVF